MKYKVIISDRAVSSLRRIVKSLKKISLIGGEDVRAALLQRIKRLSVNPTAESRKANFEKLEGEYRSIVVLGDYRIYFKIEDGRVIVLDIIMDKDGSKKI
ncbi:MAG: type II toxin-antitoxin system RelE/ParE family toxin [Flavobacteriales bacterium]|nr:type II toxin-antitoxin system RelE/ParE family toxin [Flavobacteriales bacterium]